MTSRAAPERDADRAALRDLLCADGIFRSTPEHPIVSHDGSSIAWMLDSQRISLTAPGAALVLLVWAPGRRGPLPRGLEDGELTCAFPRWRIEGADPFDATGLPTPLRRATPRLVRLRLG